MSELNKKSVYDISFEGKNVVLRTDYNVPMEGKRITDDRRIVATFETIEYMLKDGANRIIILSHLGRPDGKVELKYSLKPVYEHMEKLLTKKKIIEKTEISFIEQVSQQEIMRQIENLSKTRLVMLENIRFHKEEEQKKCKKEDIASFQNFLSSLGDVYVNDAFGTCHRGHSSIKGLKIQEKVAGILLKKELEAFQCIIKAPKKPYLALLGGKKIFSEENTSGKLELIKNLLTKVDEMIIFGGMAYTFKKVLSGMCIGNSLFDTEGAKLVPEIIETARKNSVSLHFPVDFVCSKELSPDAEKFIFEDNEGIPDGFEGLDVGPKSLASFEKVISRANSLIINGPCGVFEVDGFHNGTKSILNMISALPETVTTVIAGGDTAAAAQKFGIFSRKETPFSEVLFFVSHISTGGGATIELLEGKDLPGISDLSESHNQI